MDLKSITNYIRTLSKDLFDMNIISFADTSETDDKGQLRIISGLLIGYTTTSSVSHAIYWFSKVAKRPVKSVASAEVLGTGAAADDGLLLKYAHYKLLGTNVSLIVVVDTKDLFDTIST